MDIRYARFPVSDAGGMAVHLPIVDLGPSPARLAIVAGIHGDEPSPLLVVDRFVTTSPPPRSLHLARKRHQRQASYF